MANLYCNNCGTIAHPKTRTRGSFVLELVLWLLFILPGVIYSCWRLTTREKVCPTCGAPNMLPLDSPKARAAIAQSPAAAAAVAAKRAMGQPYGCPACGKTVRQGDARCSHCGHQLAA